MAGIKIHVEQIMIILSWMLLLVTTVDQSKQSAFSHEQQLVKDSLGNYSIQARPVINSSNAVHVLVKLEIIRIDVVSEKGQSLKTKLHIQYSWQNQLLVWKPEDYGGVKDIIISENEIWTPAIDLFNEASLTDGEVNEPSRDRMVHVKFNGTNSLSFARFFKSTCEVDVSNFPFDEQSCDMIFGSWSQDATLLRLNVSNKDFINNIEKQSNYKKNGEWHLVSTTAVEEEISYIILPKKHSVIKIEFKIERKYFFFVMNLVIPCALIACMIFLVFVLPPKSGERISLGITVMLSMAIFQELSSQKLPSSSDNFPLLGVYYATSMLEIGLAMIMNCFILNLYYRNYEMKPWVRRLLLDKISKYVGVEVPLHRTQEAMDSCKNQLTRHLSSLRESTMTTNTHVMDKVADDDSGINLTANDGFYTQGNNMLNLRSDNLRSNNEIKVFKKQRSTFRLKHFSSKRSQLSTMSEDESNHRYLTTENSMQIEDSVDRKSVAEDWRIAARVMDRVMLIISVTIGVSSAMIIFLQAKRFREMFIGK